MPRKTASQIEKEIHEALLRCRSAAAEGLWRRMRYLIEQSDRKPHARADGQPVCAREQLAKVACCSTRWVARGLPVLIDRGLIQENDAGYFSPKLVELDNIRRFTAEKVSRHRQRSYTGLRNPVEGVTSGLHRGYIGVTSPLVPSPTPPPSQPPVSERDTAREVLAEEAEKLSRARSFATGWISAECPCHLKSSRIASFVKLIIRDGKDKALEMVQMVMADPNVRDPFSYALAMDAPINGNGKTHEHKSTEAMSVVPRRMTREDREEADTRRASAELAAELEKR